jgi:hypothetical protein
LFAALIVAAALDPWVDWMARRRIPRAVSILGLYIVLLSVFIGLIWIIVPPAVDQMFGLITSLKQYAPQINAFYQTITQQSDISLVEQVQQYLSNISQTFSDFTAPVTQTISGIFSAVGDYILYDCGRRWYQKICTCSSAAQIPNIPYTESRSHSSQNGCLVTRSIDFDDHYWHTLFRWFSSA